MFDTNRKKWKDECINELKERGFGSIIEICDDGRVLLPGSVYLTDGIVTPWKDSVYFTE